MIRALLIIDVPFYREGLAALLGRSADIAVVATVSSAESLEALIAREAPDVVLLDVCAKDARQTMAILRARDEPPNVVALAITENPQTIGEWASAGVLGYLSRSASVADLLQCLQCAARGEAYCSPRVTSILLHRLAAAATAQVPRAPRHDDLTAREREILELVGRGLSNKVIAARLNISHATAKNHVHHILDKLQLTRRAEVAAYLHRHDLTHDHPSSVSQTGP